MRDGTARNGKGPCVCVRSESTNATPSEAVRTKPHDGGVYAASHTAAGRLLSGCVAVVVVVVGSKMGSNYYPKGSQIPLWDLTPRWFDG